MQKLIHNIEEFVDFFYDDFFAKNKRIKAVFRNTDIKMQKNEMRLGLLTIIAQIDDQEHLSSYLQDLGLRHISYEVRIEDYAIVKESLLRAFKHIYKEEWNTETEKEFSDLVNYICEQMILGAKSFEERVV